MLSQLITLSDMGGVVTHLKKAARAFLREQFDKGGGDFCKKSQKWISGSPLSFLFAGWFLCRCACDYRRFGATLDGTSFFKVEIGGFAFGARRKAGAVEAFPNGHPAYSGKAQRRFAGTHWLKVGWS